MHNVIVYLYNLIYSYIYLYKQYYCIVSVRRITNILRIMSGTPCKTYKRPFTVCVEGNIGCGKTTFLNHFKSYDNTIVLQEPVELWRDVSGVNLLVSHIDIINRV